MGSGCATHKPGSAAQCGGQATQQQQDQCKWIQLTPLSRLATGFSDPDQMFSNLYTRVLINGAHTRDNAGGGGNSGGRSATAAGGDQLTLDYNDRGAFLRTFWGTHYSLNLTAYVSVGSFQATVPLVTIDHASNRSEGEKFLRIVAHTVQSFPLILLKGDGSNAIATVHFVVKATDTTQSNAAAAAIQAVQGVVTAIAPEASVLTTLNSQATKDKATALDKAINSVLARQLDEEQWIDNDVRRWGQGARVSFFIPPPDHETDWADSADFREVGTWTVSFETPRPSIFADIQICLKSDSDSRSGSNYCRNSVPEAAQAAQAEAASRPEQVLNFNLLNGAQSLGTVSAYLKQQSWWDQSLKTFSALKKDEKPDEDSVGQFCRSIKQAIASVGLNAIDAGIVVAAVRDRGPLQTAVVNAMRTSGDCQYAALPPPPQP